MFGISGEHLLILSVVLLFFGPRRLPELGNTMGKAMRNFKDALAGVEEAKFTRITETQNPGLTQENPLAEEAKSKDTSKSI